MVSKSKTKEIKKTRQHLFLQLFLEVTCFSDKKRGQFTIEHKKKKREIIEERNRQVNIPPDVGEEEKKALDQRGDDATSGW